MQTITYDDLLTITYHIRVKLINKRVKDLNMQLNYNYKSLNELLLKTILGV